MDRSTYELKKIYNMRRSKMMDLDFIPPVRNPYFALNNSDEMKNPFLKNPVMVFKRYENLITRQNEGDEKPMKIKDITSELNDLLKFYVKAEEELRQKNEYALVLMNTAVHRYSATNKEHLEVLGKLEDLRVKLAGSFDEFGDEREDEEEDDE